MTTIEAIFAEEFDAGDIRLMMRDVNCSEAEAKQALRNNNYDIVLALFEISASGSDSSMDIDSDDALQMESFPNVTMARRMIFATPPRPQRQSAHPLPQQSVAGLIASRGSQAVVIPSDIPSSPTITVDEDMDFCCICMDDFNGTRDTTLKCEHTFHTDCIMGNISSADTNKHRCPLCRYEFMSEISNPQAEMYMEQLQVLEDTLHEKCAKLTHVKNAFFYFHDLSETKDQALIELKREEKCWKKETKALWTALERVQGKLSEEVAKNGNSGSYKKCGKCNCYGHNEQMCGFKGIGMQYHPKFETVSLKSHYQFVSDYVPATVLVASVLPGGDLYDTIDNHFEEEVTPHPIHTQHQLDMTLDLDHGDIDAERSPSEGLRF
jgi:hypothetical protein